MDLKITNLLGEADWKKVARHMESWAHFSREDLSTTQVYYFTALHFLNKTFYADFYIIFAMLQLHLTTNLSFEHWIQVMCSAAKNLVLSQIVLLGLSISALLSSIEVVIKYCTFWAQTYQLETLTFVSWTFQIWSLIMIFRMILMFITIQNQKKKKPPVIYICRRHEDCPSCPDLQQILQLCTRSQNSQFLVGEWLGMQLLTTFSKHILRPLVVLDTHVFAN
jgi:hypothetical protein